MKRIILLISIVILLHTSIFGQNYVLVNTFGATGVSTTDNLIGNGSAFHKLTWNVTGTVTGCTVALDSSVDGSSWSAGGVIAGQTCTSNGTILSASTVVNYVRINMTAFVGTGTVTVIDQGFINNPSGGGGSGTVGTCGATGNAYYSGAGTTTTCDPNIVDGGDGTLNISLGTITVSKPYVTVTQTWNAVGNVFTAQVHTITCTGAAALSRVFDYLVSATSIYSLKFGGSNCTLPQLGIPEGNGTSPGFYFPTDGNSTGWWRNGANDWALQSATNVYFRIKTNTGTEVQAAGSYAWSSTAQANGTIDTCADRSAAGVVRFDNNAACTDGQAKLKAAGYMSVGTTFTGNAGCSETTLTGGATAGKFTAVSTSCTIIITMGNGATAPNGWSCTAIDLTTLADVVNPHQTATTTTTATIVTGTIVSSDVIQFSCVGY